MKPTKKRAAKKTDHPMIGKLLDLKYRINEAYRGGNGSDKEDKQWVMGQISLLREGVKFKRHQMEYANGLWNKYNPSRLNNWESSRD